MGVDSVSGGGEALYDTVRPTLYLRRSCVLFRVVSVILLYGLDWTGLFAHLARRLYF